MRTCCVVRIIEQPLRHTHHVHAQAGCADSSTGPVTVWRLLTQLMPRACTFALRLFWLRAVRATAWQGILSGLQLPGDTVAPLLIPEVVVVRC